MVSPSVALSIAFCIFRWAWPGSSSTMMMELFREGVEKCGDDRGAMVVCVLASSEMRRYTTGIVSRERSRATTMITEGMFRGRMVITLRRLIY